MTILQEIHKWSQALPLWQQDAIRRLYVDRELSATDLEDLFAMAKAVHGIEDPEKREAMKLAEADVAAPPVPERRVQIVAIKNLVNVNALAEGQRLPVGQTGLTVIYGENGAGKSGYSRVLKKACRARSQAEAILPDARKATARIRGALSEVGIRNRSSPAERASGRGDGTDGSRLSCQPHRVLSSNSVDAEPRREAHSGRCRQH